MSSPPLKKKYTIWQTLREQGFFRVFHYPECPGLWGTEKKLTYKHLQVNKFCVQIHDGPKLLASREFDTFDEAHSYWLIESAKK